MNASHLSTITSQYNGSSSIRDECRPVCPVPTRVPPDPPNRSSTYSPVHSTDSRYNNPFRPFVGIAFPDEPDESDRIRPPSTSLTSNLPKTGKCHCPLRWVCFRRRFISRRGSDLHAYSLQPSPVSFFSSPASSQFQRQGASPPVTNNASLHRTARAVPLQTTQPFWQVSMNSRSDGMKHGIATRLSQRGNSHKPCSGRRFAVHKLNRSPADAGAPVHPLSAARQPHGQRQLG